MARIGKGTRASAADGASYFRGTGMAAQVKASRKAADAEIDEYMRREEALWDRGQVGAFENGLDGR